jgi:hypothetical protein
VMGESKRKEEYLCFPKLLCTCYPFFYDIVGRCEQLGFTCGYGTANHRWLKSKKLVIFTIKFIFKNLEEKLKNRVIFQFIDWFVFKIQFLNENSKQTGF